MTSFLTCNSNSRRGKWTAEEEIYAACIMEAFNEGSLDDVGEGMSLRGYLAHKLRTNVKRISKKYEGTNYNGKRLYTQKNDLDKDLVAARQAKLKELESKFEQSVKLLEDAEAAKKDMARINDSAGSLMSAFTAGGLTTMSNSHRSPSAFSQNSLGSVAALISPNVLQENTRILARQMALNSLETGRNFSAGLGGVDSLSMSSFGSFSNLEAQSLVGALSGVRSSPSIAAAGRPMLIPSTGSGTELDRMLLQHQYDALVSEVLARARSEAETAQLLGAVQGSPVVQQQPSSPLGRMALKRPPQLPSLLSLASNKRAKLV